MDTPWLTPEDVAEYLGVSSDRVRGWIASGSIESHRVPGGTRGIRVHRDDVDGFVRSWPSASSSRLP